MAHFESYNTSDPNTGATPLAGGGIITPIVIQTQQDGVLTYTCISDQPGTLFIEQSFDGQNWDYIQSFPVVANTGIGGQVSVYTPQVRIRFVNGATPQGFLRLFVRTFGAKTG